MLNDPQENDNKVRHTAASDFVSFSSLHFSQFKNAFSILKLISVVGGRAGDRLPITRNDLPATNRSFG